MKLIKIVFFLFLPISAFSQIQGDGEVYLTQERIDAKFNGGGIDKFSEFINKEFDYSKVLKAGKMEATFNVDEHGSITKIRITQMLDVESATEFIRVLKMCPKWEPAKRNGKPISIEIKYPLVFRAKKTSNDEAEQKPSTNVDSNSGNKVYELSGIETKPDFNGGLKKFYEFIGQNFRTPDVQGLKGKIYVSFLIDVDGTVTSIQVLKDIGYGTKEEAIRVMKICPKWIPGMQNGVPVRCLYSLPITIQSR